MAVRISDSNLFDDCASPSRRMEVVAALVDMHCYEWGHEDVGDVACVNVSELE